MSETQPEHYHCSWDEFHRDARRLAGKLVKMQAEKQLKWHGVIAITRGGMIPATIIARELNILLVDTLCISSYDHDKQGAIKVLKRPDGDGDGYLLIDDLVDTGKTARAAREMLPKAIFATVYAKDAGKPLVDVYERDFAQNVWIHFPWDLHLSYSEPMVR